MRVPDVGGDIRTGWRFLTRRRSPAWVAVLTLALGLGATIAVATVAYEALFKPLPFPHANRLVELRMGPADNPAAVTEYLPERLLADVNHGAHTLLALGPFIPVRVDLFGGREPERLAGAVVGADWFGIYGVKPELGRTIGPADVDRSHSHVVVLGHALWMREFGGAATVLGRQIDLATLPLNIGVPFAPAAETYTIVGVMPDAQAFPVEGDLWHPLWTGYNVVMMGEARRITSTRAIAALRPGTSVADANADLRVLSNALGVEYPTTDRGRLITAAGLRAVAAEPLTNPVRLLAVATGAVLLMTCLSVGGLIVARDQSQRRDLAIRAALGASRRQLARHVMSEGAALALAAGTTGTLLAFWVLSVVRRGAPATLGTARTAHQGMWPTTLMTDAIARDAWVVVEAGAAVMLVAFLITLLPMVTWRRDPGRLRSVLSVRFSRWLIAGELAVVCPLMIGAALALESANKLTHVDFGYRPEGVLGVSVNLSQARCRSLAPCLAAFDELIARTRSIPGVTEAAMSEWRPFSMPLSSEIAIQDPAGGPPKRLRVALEMVSPDYFATLGIPIEAGRGFTDRDTAEAPEVALASTSLVRAVGHSVIGARLVDRLGPHHAPPQIVGECADVRDVDPATSPGPTLYVPLSQMPVVWRPSLFVRTRADPASLADPVRAAVRAVDAQATVAAVESLPATIRMRTGDRTFQTTALAALGGVALLVGLVGISGVVAFAMANRAREFGLRTALGARPVDLVRLVARESAIAIAGGLTAGALVAVGLTRFLKSVLFELSATDPATFLGVVVVLAGVGGLAYFLPVRRVARSSSARVLDAEWR